MLYSTFNISTKVVTGIYDSIHTADANRNKATEAVTTIFRKAATLYAEGQEVRAGQFPNDFDEMTPAEYLELLDELDGPAID